jgi:hypothetical protein
MPRSQPCVRAAHYLFTVASNVTHYLRSGIIEPRIGLTLSIRCRIGQILGPPTVTLSLRTSWQSARNRSSVSASNLPAMVGMFLYSANGTMVKR